MMTRRCLLGRLADDAVVRLSLYMLLICLFNAMNLPYVLSVLLALGVYLAAAIWHDRLRRCARRADGVRDACCRALHQQLSRRMAA